MKLPAFLWKVLHIGPRIAYTVGLGPLIGRFVLLLTTIGRKSGKPRVTPLVYEERAGEILIASARGSSADWLKNILANPNVAVCVGNRRFPGRAELVTDPNRIADYLERQMDRSPRLFSRILRMEGLPDKPTRADLLALAPKRPMVALHPN